MYLPWVQRKAKVKVLLYTMYGYSYCSTPVRPTRLPTLLVVPIDYKGDCPPPPNGAGVGGQDETDGREGLRGSG